MRRYRRHLLLALMALATAPAVAKPAKENRRVVVDGTTFRVTLRGSDVEVASKAIVVVPSLQLRDQMRRAVKAATGCEIADELMMGTYLHGRLTCATSR